MANTTVNKVILGTETLIDLTEDTATVADVAAGKTFHLASGVQATGTGDYVQKTGDAMSGDLTIQKSEPQFAAVDSDIDATKTSVSSAIYHRPIEVYDANGQAIGTLVASQMADGRIRSGIAAVRIVDGSEITNGIYCYIANDGTLSYGLGSAPAFLSALGLAPSEGTVTLSSGTDEGIVLRKSGYMVTLSFVASGISVSTSWAQKATIPSGYRPSATITGTGQANSTAIQFQVTTAGALSVRGGSSLSNQTVRANLSWIIAA